MTDDKKVVTLPTGYDPQTPPPNSSDIDDLRWGIAMMSEELTHLSLVINNLTRALRGIERRLKTKE